MSRRVLPDTVSRLSSDNTLSSSSNDVSPSILITVIILAIAVILFASLYLLLRFLRRTRHHGTTSNNANASPYSLRKVSPVIHSLPMFTYDSLASKNGGDCAVCLSKFESDDVLRLLPVCCHAFHAECIDTWLTSNMTCPLCRSPIFLPENEIAAKVNGERSGSFRVEIGNVSNRRRDVNSSATNSGEIRRSYSLGGAFDYVIAEGDDAVADVTSSEYYKATDATTELESEERGALASEVGPRGAGGWLKDYLSTSSRTASFRSSRRWFFTGSSRRSATVEVNELGEFEEVSRLGDEIGEMFRWLSGV